MPDYGQHEGQPARGLNPVEERHRRWDAKATTPDTITIKTEPLVAGEAIKAGTEVIIKGGKLYARPATDLEKMTKRRDELLVAVGNLQEELTVVRAEMVRTQKSADNRQGHLSAQLSAALREVETLKGKLNNAHVQGLIDNA